MDREFDPAVRTSDFLAIDPLQPFSQFPSEHSDMVVGLRPNSWRDRGIIERTSVTPLREAHQQRNQELSLKIPPDIFSVLNPISSIF